jgi:hypothetical protein
MMQAGICGHAANSMVLILTEFSIRARQVHFYYTTPGAATNGHTAVEVFYDGAWHYFDPTWGDIYVRPGGDPAAPLSAETILRMSSAERARARVGYNTLLWRMVVTRSATLPMETGFAAFDQAHIKLVADGITLYER